MAKVVGFAGLSGWRQKVADAVAPRVAKKAPVDADTVRAAVGALFLALSVMYVAKSLKAIVAEMRGG